jgi:hypothetical protein
MGNHQYMYPKVTPVARPAQSASSAAQGERPQAAVVTAARRTA